MCDQTQENKSHEPTQMEKDRLTLDQKTADLERDKFDFEKKKQEFEILKTLHDAGLERWKDRRENEWKLNYAIWAAIAGLDALLLHDHSALKVSWWGLIPGGLAVVGLHIAYLWPTISRAIGEIQLQSDAEHAMLLLFSDPKFQHEIDKEHLGGSIRLYEKMNENGEFVREGVGAWIWKHYGLFAPIFFTIALVVVGCVLLRGYAKSDDKSDCKGSVVQYLNEPPAH
jgi:hypothetical protein